MKMPALLGKPWPAIVNANDNESSHPAQSAVATNTRFLTLSETLPIFDVGRIVAQTSQPLCSSCRRILHENVWCFAHTALYVSQQLCFSFLSLPSLLRNSIHVLNYLLSC